MLINKIILKMIDILIVSILLYQLFNFVKHTRAVQMIRGFIIFFILTALSGFFNFYVSEWIFSSLWKISLVVFIIVFQPEIRTALAEVGRKRIYEISTSENSVENILDTIRYFSMQHIGALIVIERGVGLKAYAETGVSLNANISSELLKSIFLKYSPLHDGAVIIRNSKISSAASFIPLTKQQLSAAIGSRHRAGIGITEVSDAFVLIVSEETGDIHYAVDGNMYHIKDVLTLSKIFNLFCGYKKEKFFNRVYDYFREHLSIRSIKRNLFEKLVFLIIGSLFWYYIEYVILK